jgi:hypothetical protein
MSDIQQWQFCPVLLEVWGAMVRCEKGEGHVGRHRATITWPDEDSDGHVQE